MLKDKLSRQHFNQKVTFNSPAPYSLGQYELTSQLAATLTGALDGSTIDMHLEYPGNNNNAPALKAVLTVRHAYFASPATYEISQAGPGYSCVTIDRVTLRKEHSGKGLGIRMFAQQAYTADLLGVSHIFVHAVGNGPNSIYNGSYTWARYGFQDMMAPSSLASFQSRFGAKDLLDLMSTEAGRALWRANCYTMSMCFDLGEDRCWNALEAYMEEKGVK